MLSRDNIRLNMLTLNIMFRCFAVVQYISNSLYTSIDRCLIVCLKHHLHVNQCHGQGRYIASNDSLSPLHYTINAHVTIIEHNSHTTQEYLQTKIRALSSLRAAKLYGAPPKRTWRIGLCCFQI